MRKILLLLMTAFALAASAQKNVYGFKVLDGAGREVSLKQFKGKVLLIVNTATHCGFTPQYKELESLYERYREQGLEILDFPCNQFGEQAPGSIQEIHQFCTATFGILFPQFDKIEVNGPGEAPLYAFLKSKQAFKGFGEGQTAQAMNRMMERRDAGYAAKADIKWNFTKFLIDRKGRVVARFEPTEDMKRVEAAIENLLAQ